MIHEHFFEFCCVVALLLLGSNLWLHFRVLRPIRRLALQAQQLSQGDFTAIDADYGGIAEIKTLRRSMVSMVKHVRRAQVQSVKYADNLTEGQEAERLRIARELHDETIQSLIAISQSIDMAKTWFKSMPEQALTMLHSAREQAVETVNGLRGLIENLRPPALEELGLVAALEMLFDKSDFPIQVQVHGQVHRLDETQELALFRCAQEALTNARRHSGAERVAIQLRYLDNAVEMRIQDNGKGFSLPKQLTDLADTGHYGLMGIQERVKQVEGQLSIITALKQGTELIIRLPLEAAHQPHDLVQDPVCSAKIYPHQAYASSRYDDDIYYFCCPVCQGAFQKEPERYRSLNEIQPVYS